MQKLNISGIKKQKKMLFYSIIGTILLTGILFFFLFAHLKNLHEERIFGNKINIPKYELVIIPRKNCHHEEKNSLHIIKQQLVGFVLNK